MSRVGKKPILIPKEVKTDIKGDLLTVKGPKGELSRKIHPRVNIHNENDQIIVNVDDMSKESRSLQGLHRALIANMVTGVSQGFERGLEIVGVGYLAAVRPESSLQAAKFTPFCSQKTSLEGKSASALAVPISWSLRL